MKGLRTLSGLHQKEFAKAMGCSPAKISSCEMGSHPVDSNFLLLAIQQFAPPEMVSQFKVLCEKVE
ncbi:MAG: helix-turn-helix domain-containing protein [Pseudobdellovibrionaceae bacterium]